MPKSINTEALSITAMFAIAVGFTWHKFDVETMIIVAASLLYLAYVVRCHAKRILAKVSE